MRLAIVRQHYDGESTPGRLVEGALEALLERNVAVSLYTRSWPQTPLKLIEPVLCNPFHLGALWRDWSFAREACAAIGDATPDLVYSHERILCCDVYHAGAGVHAAWLDAHRAAATVAGRVRLAASPYHRFVAAAERRLFASPWLQKVICPSPLVRDELGARFGLPHAKLPVIYSPVDVEVLSPALREHRARVRSRHGIADAATVFLVGGGMPGDNGADVALAALARLPGPAHLVVAGHASDPTRGARRAVALGVAGRTTFVGTGADLRPYYGAADAFVLPAVYDPDPVATLEAMACGLPVVVGASSGAATLVQEHDGGSVCRERSAEGFAAAMGALVDGQRREQQGANARQAVAPLTPAAATLQLVLLFKDLLTASAQARAADRAAAGARRAALRNAAAASGASVVPGDDDADRSQPRPPRS
jgi:UDP-glucose:(heptosyl)LPS alpha-1,3-glucosyltransferase